MNLAVIEEGTVIYNKRDSLAQLPADNWGIRKSTWDLRYHLGNGEQDFQGPKVAPGTYKVALTYGEEVREKEFELKLNPALEESGITLEDLLEQESLALEVARLLLTIQQEIKQLERKTESSINNQKKEQFTKQLDELRKGPKRYDKPMLREQVEYLLEMISTNPQKIGKDAFERYDKLKALYDQ